MKGSSSLGRFCRLQLNFSYALNYVAFMVARSRQPPADEPVNTASCAVKARR